MKEVGQFPPRFLSGGQNKRRFVVVTFVGCFMAPINFGKSWEYHDQKVLFFEFFETNWGCVKSCLLRIFQNSELWIMSGHDTSRQCPTERVEILGMFFHVYWFSGMDGFEWNDTTKIR